MNCGKNLRLLTAAMLGVAPVSSFANGMRLVSQDAFASARGEAFVATADNASAIYYNPAGITQLEGSHFRGGIYGIYLDPSYRPPSTAPNAGNTYHIENKLAAVPQFFYTHTPEEWPATFGLGIYAPYGLGVKWPQDTGFRSVATESSVTYVTMNPVMALKLADNFSIGGGVAVNYGKIKMEQGLLATETPFHNFFRFTGDGWSVGYNLGARWQPHEKISLGVTFRSSAELNFEGETEFEQQPVIATTKRSADAEFEFPLSAAFGISFRPTLKWNLEFNVDYTDWDSFDTVTIRQKTAPPFPVQQDIPVTLEWRSSWLYSFGVTRYFDNGWHASAGYVFNESSVPDDYYSPLASDLDRHFLTVGAGRKGKRFDFDVAYQFGYGPTHEVTGSEPSSTPALAAGQRADGKYNFISHAVLVTVGMHF